VIELGVLYSIDDMEVRSGAGIVGVRS